ncbi:MAG TPA: hypothetical protein VI356_22115 [Myxococcales bacterium]
MMLLALLLSATAQGDWFRAVQYAPAPAVLRGCAECQGEPDDACEVRAGLQIRPLDDYARQRWPAAGRVKLMRSNADPDCAVPARALFAARSPVELAAIRMSPSPPPPALFEQLALGPAVSGWPRRSPQRKPSAATAAPDRAALRTALVCWPSEKGWPSPAAAISAPAPGDARSTLEKANLCEWWLVAVHPDTGEPDPAGTSFQLGLKPFPATAPEWAGAFDPAVPLEDVLLRRTVATSESAPAPALAPALAPAPAPAPALAAAPAAVAAKCGDVARSRSATLDRFDQWDRHIRNSPAASLDRASFSLDAAAWSGHCQELDVLRAALEHQLGCTAALSGECSPAAPR